MPAAMAAPVPIAAGEDTLHVRITVGFEMTTCRQRVSNGPVLVVGRAMTR